LRATNGSNVQAISDRPRVNAQARWCSLSAKPTLRPAAGVETPAMWLWSASPAGAWKNPTQAPMRQSASKAPAT